MTFLLAQEDSGGGNFLVSPDVGLMIWTFLAFIVALYRARQTTHVEDINSLKF
jgi:hypothetical protein